MLDSKVSHSRVPFNLVLRDRFESLFDPVSIYVKNVPHGFLGLGETTFTIRNILRDEQVGEMLEPVARKCVL